VPYWFDHEPRFHIPPRFCDNPLVTSGPPIRFFAGGPLILENGNRIETFCLIDRRPRQLTDWELGHRRDLAKVATLELQGISATAAFLRHR
jgi:GAF domain-containing protein